MMDVILLMRVVSWYSLTKNHLAYEESIHIDETKCLKKENYTQIILNELVNSTIIDVHVFQIPNKMIPKEDVWFLEAMQTESYPDMFIFKTFMTLWFLGSKDFETMCDDLSSKIGDFNWAEYIKEENNKYGPFEIKPSDRALENVITRTYVLSFNAL